MNYKAKNLLRMSRSQLDDLFRKSTAGAIPGGGLKGTFIIAPGTPLTGIAAELIRLLAWQGKIFDAPHGRANNRVLPFSFESVPAKVYRGASRFDGKECIVLDYSETSFVARWVRDEIREDTDKPIRIQFTSYDGEPANELVGYSPDGHAILRPVKQETVSALSSGPPRPPAAPKLPRPDDKELDAQAQANADRQGAASATMTTSKFGSANASLFG